MRTVLVYLPLAWLLIAAGSALGEEVTITVFTLKGDKQVETISHASGTTQEGDLFYSVTTTTGEKKKLLGTDVIIKKKVNKKLSDLPEHARNVIAARKKASQEWAERRAVERSAEEERRKKAFIKANELAKVGKEVREAELVERTIRARCAKLEADRQLAVRQSRAAEEDVRRAQRNYDYRRRNDRNWNDRNRRSNRSRYSDSQLRNAERRQQSARSRSEKAQAELSKLKPKLAEAQKKVAEAKKKYAEALKVFKEPVQKPTESVVAETEPTQQTQQEQQVTEEPTPSPKPQQAEAQPEEDREPRARSTVVENVDQGKFIKLADHSFWKIRPEHRSTSTSWKPEQEITVVGCADPMFPYRLVNDATKMAVNARKME